MKYIKKSAALVLACMLGVSPVMASGERVGQKAHAYESGYAAAAATPAPYEVAENVAEQMSVLEMPDTNKSERFIVRYKKEQTSSPEALKRGLKNRYKVKRIQEVDFADMHGRGHLSEKSRETIQVIELDEKADIDEFSEMLGAEPGIEYVQPDYKVDLSSFEGAETDMFSEEVSGAEPTDGEVFYGGEAVIVSETAAEDGAETIVALIDTGIDIEHERLQEHIYRNTEEQGSDEDGNVYEGDINGWDFYNNSPEVYNSELGLDQAHGTHIAGVIADTAPNVKILPLKVFENGTAYTSDIIEAIQYADLMGADVVNCSWGCTEENRALEEAMEGSDMIFVCAAGNNRLDLNETPIYPACYDLDNIISVTSVNDDGGLSYFSNYGNVDIAAHGRNIESCFPEGETGTLTGTSVSAGFVSGALASVYTDAEVTIGRLYNTSDKLLNLQDYVDGGRRLNLESLANNMENNAITDVHPAEDFNVEGYSRTPEESWELFSALENVEVEAGREFVAVLKANGSVWTWGRNNYGQLGIGSYVNCEIPQQVSSVSNVAEIKSGENHMVVRTYDGDVYAWGRNYDGCLGIGNKSNSTVPVQMVNGTNAIGIGAAMNVSYVIKEDNELYACGTNGYGQIGDGTTTSRTNLTKVNINDSVRYVTGGGGASFAITTDGALYSWGHNGYGRLGNGTTTDSYTPQIIIDSGVVDVSMGFFTALAAKSDGTVYKWGYGAASSPRQVTALSGITKVVSGRQAEFALGTNTLKSMGMNTDGVLGLGDTKWHYSWDTAEGSFSDFDVYEYRAIGLGADGCIYIWGDINKDTGEYVTAPVKISGRINDFAGDSFEESAELSEGLTFGKFTADARADYYKFTPTSTGLYSVYSISSMDLVCKIYTQNSDGAYTLTYSNDDSSTMSSNRLDFYLMKTFTAGTDYYIYVYPYSSRYTGDYELHLERDSYDNAYTFTADKDEIKDVFISLNHAYTLTNRVIKVTYDSSSLLLADGCVYTRLPDTMPKKVPGTNITIVSVSDGELVFSVDYNIPVGLNLSGTVNIMRFISLVSGSKTIQIEIRDITN